MGQLWRKIEKPESVPVFIENSDECYFAREYVSHGGYQAGKGNGLISNFKKNPDRRGKPEWRWKENAIEHFASELNALIVEGVVAAIPTSKRRDDPAYDSRFDVTLSRLAMLNSKVTVTNPFCVKESHQSVHTGGERSIQAFYDCLDWVGFGLPPDEVILIDDVVTTGAHFAACKRMLLNHHPETKVFGVFWAKVVWQEVDGLV